MSQLTVSRSDKEESPPTSTSNDLKPLNGHKRPLSATPPVSPTIEKRSKLDNHNTTAASSKPIISPIKLSSDSEDESSRYHEVHKNDKSRRIKSRDSRHHERSGRHKTERKSRKREARSSSRERRSWSRDRSNSRERWRERRYHHYHRDDDHHIKRHRK